MVNQENIYKFKPSLKMKKLVFTALAVVAFSGVSFAGTKEVKVEVAPPADCQTLAMDYIDEVYDRNHTHTNVENNIAYQGYLQGCEDQQQ